MSTKIIMIRHGFSEANLAEVFTGQSNIALTDVGLEQARLCGEYFKEWCPCSALGAEREEKIWDLGIPRIDAIYSSDLKRAYDTALPVADALSLEVEKCEALREIYAGEWELMPFVDIDEKYPVEYGVWKKDIGRAKCVRGESVAELSKRVLDAVRNIAVRHDGGAVVLVTHATPIRAVCAAASGLDACDMGKVSWVSNASISVFEFDGTIKAVRTNIVSHLGQLKTDLPKNV
ncbi:MAG: histidine phosphatase family protein [Clostridia bacterium]|nr:histidine phosphatase family protein [Clostridia bacterium]